MNLVEDCKEKSVDEIQGHLAKMLKDRRKALGYTQAEIADKLQVVRATVLSWESLGCIPSWALIKFLAIEPKLKLKEVTV